ncbi:MAG TPA: PD-(D/E)XK nuclease family protein, partial [Nocardioidaceae bacterium]|nr:PD-(D/E)XK nuclease family protein [Nocardioidaceae bacterium]
RADAGIDDEDDFRALVEQFNAGPFAERVPAAIEAPFALVLGGQVIRGRIDAAYRDDAPAGGHPEPAGARAPRHLVVDWKTSRGQDADPLQLAVYRLAWAELQQVPVEQVDAAFYYVRSGELVHPTGLPDRAELERLFATP